LKNCGVLSMRKVIFEGDALPQFMYWVHHNIKIVDKIYSLLENIDRNGPSKGLGKPERLKHFDGWSRHITDEHRLVYSVTKDAIHIIACKGHYE